jgi:hypothetical protein
VDLNIRPETLKLVQKRAGNSLESIGIGKDFFSRTQLAQQLRKGLTMEPHEIKKLLHKKRNGL